ncbi:unnamed protein product [Miscanthus lutarioriparius]|uniref:Uncharacterized protein n=1 Tax=Miscanthus lutarioriparius TaxID=422564 RepID=A0A811PNH7_9POAL|nr:unnamed protein product [Miscanthus lutarioriparius]
MDRGRRQLCTGAWESRGDAWAQRLWRRWLATAVRGVVAVTPGRAGSTGAGALRWCSTGSEVEARARPEARANAKIPSVDEERCLRAPWRCRGALAASALKDDNVVSARGRTQGCLLTAVEKRKEEREKHAADKDGDPASPALSAWDLKFDMHG